MAEINVCIPTLNAYKELENCIDSILSSVTKVDNIYILDNGGSFQEPKLDNIHVIRFGSNIGVSRSWNWFIQNVPEIRIICNDDVQFTPDAIAIMLQNYDEDHLIFPNGLNNMNSFSCFILPNKVINSVGLFDESISPNYAYFEDNDYHRRMKLSEFDIKSCNAEVGHVGSATLKGFDKWKEIRHHEKFKLARTNYVRKWGGEPGKELYSTPYNRQ